MLTMCFQVIPVTFASDASYIRVNGYMQRQMNTSFDFRTFNENGMLLYNKFSGEGHVLVYLEKVCLIFCHSQWVALPFFSLLRSKLCLTDL